MRYIVRQFRRPTLILAALYLAFVGLLCGLLPYQPAMIVPRGDFHQMLIGFSPDGRRLATGPRISHLSIVNLNGGPPLPDDPFQFWSVTSGPAPTRIEVTSDLEDQVLLAFARNPAGRRFFWPYVDDLEFRHRLGRVDEFIARSGTLR
jgi:hypothetical protein